MIKPNTPRVIMRSGRVIVSKIGFTNKLSKPNMIASNKYICQIAVIGNPKKFEFVYKLTQTPGTKYTATQSPIKEPAI